MGLYQHVRDAWKKPRQEQRELRHERLIEWRREDATTRLERPTRIDRARSLGYKAKQGIFVVRQRVLKGGHTRPQLKAGRRSRNQTRKLSLHKNYRQICEERVQKKFENMNVLNSYWVGKDGQNVWYEVILVDPNHPAIQADKDLKWICEKQHKARVFRGLTSAGKTGRGLQNKGKGAEKMRPSRRANLRRG